MTLHPTGGIELSEYRSVYLLAIALKRFSLSPNIWCALHWKINNEKKITDTTHSLSLRSYAHMERNFYDHTINIYWRRLYEPAVRFELDNSTDEAISLFFFIWCNIFEWLDFQFRFIFVDMIWIIDLIYNRNKNSLFDFFFVVAFVWKIENLYDYLMMLIKHIIIWLDFFFKVEIEWHHKVPTSF